MSNYTSNQIGFPGVKGRKLEAVFSGQSISSDGGAVLLRAADARIKLLSRAAKFFEDGRRSASCAHSVENILRQRVFALALGYEDLNDHDDLRHDLALQAAVGRDVNMASSPTLCRFENRVTKKALWGISSALADVFLESHSKAPKEIVLDFDSTDDAVHGRQEGRFFHGYYDHYCFLPLYVFCGNHLLTAYLRPSNIDNAKHTLGILALLTKKIRQTWPHTRIVFRGDSGFCRWKLMRWCDKHDVGYIIGLARNQRLEREARPLLDEVYELFLQTGKKQKQFTEIQYSAKSWDKERRVIIKAEHLEKGSNPRFVVTNLSINPESLYKTYCARRNGKQNKRTTIISVCRQNQLQQMAAESISGVALRFGLHPAEFHTQSGSARNGVGPGPL